eukprot:CAMPEP_0116546952 /NCGR_PEP_ID=MMETSP0397-20121206/3511_1 /TAXON_ID=216820 /ORGANISM="Cyclophora tenuis, Strain ECT3854" /LENGTH=70 /DNA_ID=CAMNT_0004071437 /DNA_START=958 /DNA_END=1170 /DNA_ORIENTATION=+
MLDVDYVMKEEEEEEEKLGVLCATTVLQHVIVLKWKDVDFGTRLGSWSLGSGAEPDIDRTGRGNRWCNVD